MREFLEKLRDSASKSGNKNLVEVITTLLRAKDVKLVGELKDCEVSCKAQGTTDAFGYIIASLIYDISKRTKKEPKEILKHLTHYIINGLVFLETLEEAGVLGRESKGVVQILKEEERKESE